MDPVRDCGKVLCRTNVRLRPPNYYSRSSDGNKFSRARLLAILLALALAQNSYPSTNHPVSIGLSEEAANPPIPIVVMPVVAHRWRFSLKVKVVSSRDRWSLEVAGLKFLRLFVKVQKMSDMSIIQWRLLQGKPLMFRTSALTIGLALRKGP